MIRKNKLDKFNKITKISADGTREFISAGD
jgi:hypothetical protein